MKRGLPVVVAILSGLAVIAGILFRPVLGGYLGIVLNWAVIVASMALLVAIASLVLTHLRYIIKGRKGFLYSIVLVVTFLLTLGAGLSLGVDDPTYLQWVSGILRPLETALMGLIALVMTGAALQIFRTRGWTPLTVSFGVTALVFLVISLGLLQALNIPMLDSVILTLQGLPVIGARGLLIGISLGALLMGLRVMLGNERPYGG